MRHLVRAVLAAAVVLLLVVVPATAADPSLPHSGRVLVSTGGDVVLPAGEQADAVIVVNGTATIHGRVNTVVAVDGAAVLTDATVETVVAIRSPLASGRGPRCSVT